MGIETNTFQVDGNPLMTQPTRYMGIETERGK